MTQQPDVAWARPGTAPPDPATVLPPRPAPPAPPESPPQAMPHYPMAAPASVMPQYPVAPASLSQRGRRGLWMVTGAAAVLAVAAAAMGTIDLTRPAPAPITTTVAPGSPTFPPDQVAAARAESCAASLNASKVMTAASRDYAPWATQPDSPDRQAALAKAQMVVMVETTYLEQHTPPATPAEVANPTRDFITAWRDADDDWTRGLDDAVSTQRANGAVGALNKACGG